MHRPTGLKRIHTLLRVLAAVPIVAALAYCALADAPLPDRDFAEYLLGRDLVIEATFLGADKLERTPLGGCGIELPKTKSLDLRLRVERVIFGTAEDSTIVISTLGQPQFPPGAYVPGAHVIAWGNRECADGWRLWGNMVIVTAGGKIVGDYNSQGLFIHGEREDRPMGYAALNAKLGALAAHHSTKYFDEKEAVGLVRVLAIQRTQRGAFTYECDSLGWVLGESTRMPRFIDVNVGNLGCDWARSGDSLLVPVAADQSTDRATLPGCSGAMLIKNGYARGFGVPLSFLPYALKASPTGVHVRSFIGNDK